MKNDNEFPRNIFPKEVRDYIESYSDSQGLCKDFMYSSFLTVASVMIGNGYSVNINNNWNESALVWVALVGRSGIKKTPVIKSVLKPLQEIDYENFKLYLQSTKDGGTALKLSQKIVDDVTIEALYEILNNNPKGVLLKKDELTTLISDGERYSKGGGTIDKFLSIYSGMSIQVNRKTNNQFLYITNPFVSIIGGIQPKIIPQLFEKNRADNGFIYRILFATVGKHIPKAPTNTFDQKVFCEYENYIRRFESISSEISISISLSKDAYKYFYDWQKKFIYIENEDDRLQQYKSKLEGYALRFSLIVEVCYAVSEQKEPKEVSLASIENAIRLCDYFYSTFKEILLLSNPPSAPENIQLTVKNKAIELFKKGLIQKEVVFELLKEGFKQVEISRYLDIPRTTISSYR